MVVPIFADQFFWGARVHEFGAGPVPLPFSRLSAEGLAAAISRAMTVESVRGRAMALSSRLRKEDGVGQAIRALRSIWRLGSEERESRAACG